MNINNFVNKMKLKYMPDVYLDKIIADYFYEAIDMIKESIPDISTIISEKDVSNYFEALFEVFETGIHYFDNWIETHPGISENDKEYDIAAYILSFLDDENRVYGFTTRINEIRTLETPDEICEKILNSHNIPNLDPDTDISIYIFLAGVNASRKVPDVKDLDRLKSLIFSATEYNPLVTYDEYIDFAFVLPDGMISHLKDDPNFILYLGHEKMAQKLKTDAISEFDTYYLRRISSRMVP